MERLLQEMVRRQELSIQGAYILPLTLGAPEDKVDDGPLRASVVDHAGSPAGVLFLANPGAPQLSHRSAVMAATAKSLMGAKLGRVILDPLALGEFEGRSYVCWPWCRPLSQSRYLAFAQKTALAPSIVTWLAEVTRKTAQLEGNQNPDRGFVKNLQHLTADPDFPQTMRDAAKRGIERITDGKWKPKFVFEHGDFWMGNVLWPHQKRGALARLQPFPFTLIDWAGATSIGYPMVDLTRFAVSSGSSPRALRRQLNIHCRILGCHLEDAPYNVLASLGHLGRSLENFPRDRYLNMGATLFETIERASLGRMLS